MSKELVMQFLTDAGSKTSIKVKYVKDNLTKAEVQTAMDSIIGSNAFQTKAGILAKKSGAKIVDTSTEEISFTE
ncbi:Protein of unknown function [Hathewaya proteolytica DSM 3090]|uniref:DUF2922 domain-containing protein n=1 Tax=Hathewaya proteolytica DSM 3090 TaxID=1121331 RepID=A0A1M6R4V4_9CLOT|nr:DUF2922 domain-containing protein [Hathewaya proteolytica]SHK27484.1 Protein of unknown function [Hathewaya proteolytica DSM 3090]